MLVMGVMVLFCVGLGSCGNDDSEDVVATPGTIPAKDTHEYVDLGLSDGTLWATMNVGASSPEEYGDYFAWGETQPKVTYSFSTYIWCDGAWNKMTKYNTESNNGTVDGLTELLPEDDAAYVNWGPNWRMPSLKQFKNLIVGCNWQWTQLNGVYGQQGKSKTNGNTIFFPAAGYRTDASLSRQGEYGHVWSRTLNYSDGAYNLLPGISGVDWDSNRRDLGQSVRPVRFSE